jgi:hypothetical protein|nr:MAG TPA: head completion protein [Caudoviricetes sp.]
MASNTLQGKYTPIHPEKYLGDVDNIVYRSGWERRLMVKLDISPQVIQWGSEELIIPYFDSMQRKTRRYFVDFVVLFKTSDGTKKKLAIEVKPYSQTIPPKLNSSAKKKANAQRRYLRESTTYQNNMDKWRAAEDWCNKNGFYFLVLHEKNVGGLF